MYSARNKVKQQRYIGTAVKVRILTSIISLIEGYDIGVINGAILLFQEELQLSPLQLSVVLAIFPLGVSLCAPFAASLADWRGRKPAMLVSCLMLMMGGTIMACAISFETLALGRITCGAGVGIGITAVTAYMSEVSPASHRGLFGSLEELFVNLGNVVGYLTNFALLDVHHSWRYMLGGAVIPACFVALTLSLPRSISGIPESPRYLYKKGQLEEATEVLVDLLDSREEVNDCLDDWRMEVVFENRMAPWRESLTAFCTDKRWQAAAGIGCGILNMFTGIMLMMVMTTTLLVGVGMTKYQAMQASIMIGLAKCLVMLLVAIFFLDDYGRRPLMLTSLTTCICATLLGMTSSFYQWGSPWIVVSLLFFVTGYSLGMGPVPWVYMPEVLDSRFRGKGCALGVAGARICAATHLFCFPIIFPMIGVVGLFVFLACMNASALVYVYLLCPETKGAALEKIPSMFLTPRSTLKMPSCSASMLSAASCNSGPEGALTPDGKLAAGEGTEDPECVRPEPLRERTRSGQLSRRVKAGLVD